MAGQHHDSSSAHEATLGLDQLSERIDALIAAWDAATEPPALAGFLPAGPPLLRRLALIELIKVDLEYRCQKPEHTRRIEQYLDEFPELGTSGAVPCELIYEEYHLRKLAGQQVDAREYFDRFPKQAPELGRLLGLESPHLSTSIGSNSKFEEIEVGHKIDDFDLLTRLGRGAFATVFLARQQSMQRIVALKVSADRGNEPQTMALLDHPHIVRVFDQRQLPERKLRLLYMQYIPGGTLQTVCDGIRQLPPAMRTGQCLLDVIDQALANRGESPPTDSRLRARLAKASWPQVVCWLGSRLAAALDYAHSRGVLHRDVKPANVLVAADGTPKLADFNISFSSKVEGATAAAYFGGSLAYMSPEQLEACSSAHDRTAEDLDGRSDIYSLGVVLWELLTGNRPFADVEPNSDWSKTLDTMIGQRRDGVPAATVAKLPSNCPAGLKQILLNCLSADRDKRYASPAGLSRQLELSLQPQVLTLLRPRPGSVRNWVRRYPLIAMFAAGLIPNIIYSVLNVLYNFKTIFTALGYSFDQVIGHPVVTTINSLAFGISIAVLLPIVWPVVRAVTRVHRGCPQPIDRDPRWISRSLILGDLTAGVSGFMWFVTGWAFPIWLTHYAQATQVNMPTVFVHFMVTQLLCGLMAISLVFFMVAFLSTRAYYPTLLQVDVADPVAIDRVRRLERRTWVYFAMAVVVPFIAVIAVVGLDSMRKSDQAAIAKSAERAEKAISAAEKADEAERAEITASTSTSTIVGLGAVGLLNSVVAFVFLRAVQKAIGALSIAASPPGTVSIGGTDSATDSFWN